MKFCPKYTFSAAEAGKKQGKNRETRQLRVTGLKSESCWAFKKDSKK
jgi:hypothetical protein